MYATKREKMSEKNTREKGKDDERKIKKRRKPSGDQLHSRKGQTSRLCRRYGTASGTAVKICTHHKSAYKRKIENT